MMKALSPHPPAPTLATLACWIAAGGGGFVGAKEMHALLMQVQPWTPSDWRQFERSWDGMPADQYIAGEHRYRSRRYATLSAAPGQPARLAAPQPHVQSAEYNPLFGGIARHFAPIASDVLDGPCMRSVFAFGCALFGRVLPDVGWHIEAHQFRIEAAAGHAGQPTPEGVHRDGVDFVLVMLVRRVNIASGTTSLYDASRRKLGSFTLTKPGDAALLDDRRCYHGVTPVVQIDPALPAYRDVLVVTWRRS